MEMRSSIVTSKYEVSNTFTSPVRRAWNSKSIENGYLGTLFTKKWNISLKFDETKGDKALYQCIRMRVNDFLMTLEIKNIKNTILQAANIYDMDFKYN